MAAVVPRGEEVVEGAELEDDACLDGAVVGRARRERGDGGAGGLAGGGAESVFLCGIKNE